MAFQYAERTIRDNLAGQVSHIEETIANPIAWNEITDKAAVAEQHRKLKRSLQDCTPPDLVGKENDAIRARTDELATAMVLGKQGMVCPMPTQHDMEKCPVGAEGRHIEHERFWQSHTLNLNGDVVRVEKDEFGRASGRSLFEELKDSLRVVHKEREEYDPDTANLEQFRPVHALGGPALADQRLPQSFGMPRISYFEHVQQHPEFVPTIPAVKAGLYPGFELNHSGEVIRNSSHPAFDRLGPACVGEDTVKIVEKIKSSRDRESAITCTGTTAAGTRCRVICKHPSGTCKKHRPGIE